jgi:hypothetical protein
MDGQGKHLKVLIFICLRKKVERENGGILYKIRNCGEFTEVEDFV